MGSIVLSTDWCYEAPVDPEQDPNGEDFIVGSYSDLYDHPGLENPSDISFSQSAWEDEKAYFGSFLADAISAYEKRYRTTVEMIALAGSVGLWNGSPIGGKFLNTDDNPLEHMGDVDDIDVYIADDHEVTLRGHHHDGTHRMCIYFLPTALYENLRDRDYEAFQWLYGNRKTLKANSAKGFFGGYQTGEAS